MITLKDIKENQELDALIRGSQKQLNAIGYTEHGHRHISIVSKRAGDILEKLGYPERTVELTRIAGDMSAALILADKSDVHRDRLVNKNLSTFDIHDRVNYAVTDADLIIDEKERKIKLKLTIDTTICPVLDYFEIFMQRTMICKYAAKYLKICFELIINDTKLL